MENEIHFNVVKGDIEGGQVLEGRWPINEPLYPIQTTAPVPPPCLHNRFLLEGNKVTIILSVECNARREPKQAALWDGERWCITNFRGGGGGGEGDRRGGDGGEREGGGGG